MWSPKTPSMSRSFLFPAAFPGSITASVGQRKKLVVDRRGCRVLQQIRVGIVISFSISSVCWPPRICWRKRVCMKRSANEAEVGGGFAKWETMESPSSYVAGPKCKTPQPPRAGRWGAVPPDSPLLQSRKATEAIALERFSVFISTRCQPSSRIVAWSGWVILPRT